MLFVSPISNALDSVDLNSAGFNKLTEQQKPTF